MSNRPSGFRPKGTTGVPPQMAQFKVPLNQAQLCRCPICGSRESIGTEITLFVSKFISPTGQDVYVTQPGSRYCAGCGLRLSVESLKKTDYVPPEKEKLFEKPDGAIFHSHLRVANGEDDE